MSKRPWKRRKSRAARRSGLPKGGYRLPTGGILMPAVVGPPDRNGRCIVVRAVRRDPIDLKLLAKALVAAARDEAARKTD